ncbi:MAG TPA: serine/threonine-protein kinase, partial [Nannocystaceae bacterium]|nr:serine/threonine-protein kinase [Nannocystaceae bacterium]
MSGDERTWPGAREGLGRASVGAEIGRYVVLEPIAEGGMGRVLSAYDPKLQREVALKEVRSRLLGAAGARRLVAEARAMAKLAHPHVVAVYDVEELADGGVVLVMEYVAGQTLTKWLQQSRPWWDTIACFRRAGRGLAAAHAAGLLHRDFKPDNVLIAEPDVVKVTDFGLAKLAEHDRSMSSASASAPIVGWESSSDPLTATGAILGTPRYMAPEQHAGEALGPAADQYAYCVALWYALTGAAPFDQHAVAELERAKTAGPPAWPGGPTPRPIVDAIARGLAADPSRRWPSMDALLEALAHDPTRRRKRWGQAAAIVGVAGLAAAVVQAWASARARRCSADDASAHLAGAWDDARRTEVREAVLGIGADYAKEVWTATE